ncbi:unnamed protein product (mitochondrion) [Plasmodiophora brassicae]|uniref:Non-specific serine/threonine protein kinase n=1 Tax=Plasmodiophora brassicae TaxID=37360 RepID=A0A0G4J8E9_PLABS|nr:hypothetical protein PBRA_009456 [Plasmodiophora brassicae]SPR01714.1 unnamed protein product [Plasmodiophora brassicae]
MADDDDATRLLFDFSPSTLSVASASTAAASFVCPCGSLSCEDPVGPVAVEIDAADHDLDLHHLPSTSCGDHDDHEHHNGIPVPANTRSSSPRNQVTVSSAGLTTAATASRCRPHLDDFQVLAVLGQGGYGKVYLVATGNTRDTFAMKCMKKADIVRRNVVKYAHSERSVLIAISHPFLVHLRFAFQSETKLYLIMDYIAGGELFSRLNAEQFFTEPVAVFYAAEIVLALAHLHSNDIIYRDLKPENLMIQRDGHICLTDFGLAKPVNREGTRTLCGTLAYLAPEVISKRIPYGKPADWWSFGILLYEMLAGQIPFDSENPKELQKKILSKKLTFPGHVSNNARSILKRLLCRDVNARLGSKGVDQIKSHAFFASVNWTALERKLATPPFIPELNGPTDTTYFDPAVTGRILHSPVDEKESTLSESFQRHFQGFSFAR